MDVERSPSRFYRPELDALRFLAFLSVFFCHMLPTRPTVGIDRAYGSFAPVIYSACDAFTYGLSLFFVLSAYLICELLLRERAATGTVRVKQFYIRRILRIWPLYYLALAIGVLYAWVWGTGHRGVVAMGWYAIFLGPWYAAMHGWPDNPMTPLWSISVEEQFYALAPGVVRFLTRRALLIFCLVLVAISNYSLSELGHTWLIRAWSNSLVQFEYFAFGILLCLALRGRAPELAAYQRVLLMLGGYAAWFFACYTFHTQWEVWTPGTWSLSFGFALGGVGSGMMLLAFLGVSQKAIPRWAIYLGRISYGLYVFHLCAKSMVETGLDHFHLAQGTALEVVATFGLAVLMAEASFRWFEKPFLRFKRRHEVVNTQPV